MENKEHRPTTWNVDFNVAGAAVPIGPSGAESEEVGGSGKGPWIRVIPVNERRQHWRARWHRQLDRRVQIQRGHTDSAYVQSVLYRQNTYRIIEVETQNAL